jgi:hypothetical protein
VTCVDGSHVVGGAQRSGCVYQIHLKRIDFVMDNLHSIEQIVITGEPHGTAGICKINEHDVAHCCPSIRYYLSPGAL